MRYYHYGNKGSNDDYGRDGDGQMPGHPGSFINMGKDARDAYNSSLVIEDDTVYEIDEECMLKKNY